MRLWMDTWWLPGSWMADERALSWLLDWLLALLRLLLRVGALWRMARRRWAIVAISSSSSSSASAADVPVGINSWGRLGVVGDDIGLRFSTPPFSSPFRLNSLILIRLDLIQKVRALFAREMKRLICTQVGIFNRLCIDHFAQLLSPICWEDLEFPA